MSKKKQKTKVRKHYYFAYGSNMNFKQMFSRCKHAKHAGLGEMIGWRLAINERGYANIIKDENSTVEGCLWEVTEYHLGSLDFYEGVNDGHYSHVVAPVMSDLIDDTIKAHVYIDFYHTDENYWPNKGYGDRVYEGAIDNGLSLDYLETLKKVTEEEK